MGDWITRATGNVAAAVAMLAVVGMVACLDYDLNRWGEEEVPVPEAEEGDDDDFTEPPGIGDPDLVDMEHPEGEEEEPPPEEDDPPEELPEEEDLPDCEDTIMADWQWWGSMPFGHEEDLTDGNGLPF